jgi:hypothetical protein
MHALDMALSAFQERIRARLRDWCEAFTHEQIAESFHVDRSAISKLFREGGSAITLEHLEGFSFLLQRTPSEIVSEYGAVIQSVTPIEAALLAIVRDMTELERRSLLTVLERPITSRSAAKKTRLGRSMLTVKEQELVDLYARVKKDGVREGVLKTLRGAAEADDVRVPVKPRTTG